MRFVKQVKAAYIALSIAFVCMGLCLLIWPGISAVTICYVLGTASVLYGVIKLFGYFSEDLYQLAFQFDLAAGIFMLVIGILLLFHPDNVLTLLPTVIGLSILIDSVLKLQTAFDAKHFGMDRWWMILLFAIVAAVFGILLLAHPFESMELLMRLMGITILISGIENLCAAFYTIKVTRHAKKETPQYYDVTAQSK